MCTIYDLRFGGRQPYVWNGWSYSGQILYTTLTMPLKGGVVWVTWPSLNLGATVIYLARFKLESSKNFADTQVAHTLPHR